MKARIDCCLFRDVLHGACLPMARSGCGLGDLRLKYRNEHMFVSTVRVVLAQWGIRVRSHRS